MLSRSCSQIWVFLLVPSCHTPDTPVLGAIPEMDSMSVIGILASLEEQYGITVDDDEISADVFATVGSLTTFVESKLK